MKKIEQKASELLKEYEISTPPVHVENLARKLGVKLSFEPFEGDDAISGILYRDNDNTVIGVNSAHAKTRQRFTIAHEIGHLKLHNKKLFIDKVFRVDFRDQTSSLARDREEIQANSFAAALLMPRDFLIREIKRRIENRGNLSSQKLIEELARAFEVSSQAMEYRLTNLGFLITN